MDCAGARSRRRLRAKRSRNLKIRGGANRVGGTRGGLSIRRKFGFNVDNFVLAALFDV